MPTIAEQELAIINDVWNQIEWCECYEECWAIIEQGREKIKALTTITPLATGCG